MLTMGRVRETLARLLIHSHLTGDNINKTKCFRSLDGVAFYPVFSQRAQ